jgi:hypothetical protein
MVRFSTTRPWGSRIGAAAVKSRDAINIATEKLAKVGLTLVLINPLHFEVVKGFLLLSFGSGAGHEGLVNGSVKTIDTLLASRPDPSNSDRSSG